MNNFRVKEWSLLLVNLALLTMPYLVSAQNSEVGIRFSNPSFDCDNRTYCVDVEYQSDASNDIMYGTNIRFFYNSAELSFIEFSDMSPGYDVSVVPSPQTGQPSSGADLFGFDANQAATWINGAIQLEDLNNGKVIGNNQWTKFYQVCFNLEGNPQDIDNFCPTLVWDLEQDRNQGGFFQGDNGVVITIINQDNSTTPVGEVVDHFNWDYSGDGTAPYGDPSTTPEECVTSACVCNIIAPSLVKSP